MDNPSKRYRREDEHLEEGDLVSIDVTSELGGWHGDNCASFALGALSAERAHLLDVGRRCRDAGIAALRDGVRLGDVGAAIEALARREGCSVVRDYGGHGIGRAMHLPPHVAHVGPALRGVWRRCATRSPLNRAGCRWRWAGPMLGPWLDPRLDSCLARRARSPGSPPSPS